MILFETAWLIIRMWEQTDLAAFQALNADQTVMEYFPKVYQPQKQMIFILTFKLILKLMVMDYMLLN